MPALPSKADLDGSSVGHNQGVFKTAIGALRDFLAGIAGTAGTPDDAINAMRVLDSSAILNLSLTPSIGAGAFTMNVKTRAGAAPAASDPVMVAMRNATAGSGDFNLRKITAAVALTISSGSTLGLGNSDQNPIYWYLIDNAGALELAVSAKWFGTSGIVSTTAEGGAGAADSATVMYSATARTNVPYRCIGVMTAPQTAAGTWAALPTSLDLTPSPLTLPGDGSYSYRNGIRNGGFKVAQRGSSSSGAGLVSKFYLDGWYNYGGPSNYSISQIASAAGCISPKAMRFGRTAGETQINLIGFVQSLESIDCRKYAGRNITLSFKAAKGANFSAAGGVISVNVNSGTGTDQAAVSGFTGQRSVITAAPVLTGALQSFSYSGAVNIDCNQLGISFSYVPVGTAGAADYLDITDIQLEIGPVATFFEDRPYEEELRICQRFFRRWNIATGSPVGQFQAVTTSSCNGGVRFPRMRAAPSAVNISGNFDCQPAGGGSAAIASYGASALDVESCVITWGGITGSPLVVGDCTMVTGGGGAYIEIMADL